MIKTPATTISGGPSARRVARLLRGVTEIPSGGAAREIAWAAVRGVFGAQDEDLDLPRAPEWTYSVGLNHDLELGNWGFMSSRLSYAYRDETAYTDSNLGYILEQEIVDAGLDFHTDDGRWVFSLYGKNLLDEVKHGGDTQLPDDLRTIPWGGTFSPLTKGRHYGAEIVYNFF